MDNGTAQMILLAEVKAMLARGEPLVRLLDEYFKAYLVLRHPGLAHFLPWDEGTIYHNYVIPINQKSFKK